MRFETRAALKPERLKNEEDEEGAGKMFGDNNLRLQLGTDSQRAFEFGAQILHIRICGCSISGWDSRVN